jgi:hypothetical protein
MIELLFSTLIFGLLTLVSLFASYYVTVMMSQSESHNAPRVNNVIMTQSTLLMQSVVNSSGDIISLITSKFFEFIANIRQNFKTYLNMFALASIFIAYLSNKESFLSNVDKLWRCAIHPLFVNILFVILQVLRLLWGAVIPLYNYQTTIAAQLLDGTRIIYTKCNYVSLFDSLQLFLNIFLSTFQSIATWAGAVGELSIENNPVTNELNVTNVVVSIQKLVLKQSEVSSCVCEGLTDVFEFVYILFRQKELALAINHLINIPVAFIQGIIQSIPPWSRFPLGIPIFNHWQGFVFYTFKYLDQVFMKWGVQLISLFDDNFKVQSLPEEFFASVVGRLIMAGSHFMFTIVRIFSSLQVPIGKAVPNILSADHMVQVFAMDQAMEHLSLAVVDATNMVSWFLKIQNALTVGAIKNAVNEADQIFVLPAHVHVVCDQSLTTFWADQKACALRLATLLAPDVAFTIYTMVVEILWKSLVFQEENIIQIFQRYDGISFPRTVELTCEYRDSIEYDLTAGECRCDLGLGTFHPMVPSTGYPFGRPHYDRYCGQPNLQVNYFGSIERTQKYLTSGFLENVQDIAGLTVLQGNELTRMLLKAVLNLENIVSGDYFMYKVNCGYGMSSQQLRAWYNETDNTTTLSEKIENSQNDYCKGGAMQYSHQIGGTRCKLIDTVIRDLMCFPTANLDGRTVVGHGTIHMDRCDTVNKAGCGCNFALANYCIGHKTQGADDSTSIESEQACTDVYSGGVWVPGSCNHTHDPMRIYPTDPMEQKVECEDPSNVEKTVWTPARCDGQTLNGTAINATSKGHCERVTVAGVWRGAIPFDNKCQCIRAFPDTVMEYVQGPWENHVLTRFHSPDVSLHWCNTMWAAWYFYYIDQFSYAVEAALGTFHPAYAAADDGSNPYCEESTFTMFEHTILNYPLWRFNEDKDIYNQLQLSYDARSCDVWGTSDMICSAGMTFRNAVRLVVNEARVLSISVGQVLEFDFSQIKITLSERLCDLARAASALSSVIPAILPDNYVDPLFQKGVSQIIYSLMYIVIALLDTANHFLVFMQDLITGNMDWSQGAAAPFFNLMFGVINVWIDFIRMIFQSFGNVLNGIERGAGDTMFTIDKVLDTVQKYLINEAAFEIIGLVGTIVTDVVEFFTAGMINSGIAGFLSNLWKLLTKFILLLLKNAGKVLSALLDMLGPAGDFIRTMANSICGAIEDALCFISVGSLCDIGCGSGLRHNRRHLFSAGNASSDFQDVVFHVSHHMDWNGTSNCDLFIHSYKDYKWDDMRPLEHITLLDCVEQRMMVVNLNRGLNVSIPEDMLYNWKRKWFIGKTAVEGFLIYLNHKLGSLTTKQMLHQFKEKGIPYDTILHYSNMGKTHIRNVFSMKSAGAFMEQTFREFDPNIEKGTTGISNVYRLMDISRRAGVEIYEHAKRDKFHSKLQKTMATIHQNLPRNGIEMPSMAKHFPNHLKHGFDTWHKTRHLPTSVKKTTARHFVLRAAGIQTDITPCNSRSDSFVCINCVVVDNFLNTVIREGIRMSEYYKNVYGPVTVPSFAQFWTNNTEAQAWREDVGASLESAFVSLATDSDVSESVANSEIDLNADPNEAGPALERHRLYSNHSYSNQTLSYFKRAGKDWDWFFAKGWNFLQDHSMDPEVRPNIAQVLILFLAGDYDQYVPYFAHPLIYYLDQIFPRECPMDIIYCRTSSFGERQRLIGDAGHYILYFLIALLVIHVQFGFPIIAFLGFFIPFIVLGIYNYTVYSYTIFCVPNLPNCWADDLYAFVHDTLFPSCFCYYLPGLSKNCNPDSCFLCSRTTEFHTCSDQIPLFDDMGILWSTAFFIRKNYPAALVYMYKTIPFAWAIRNYQPLVTMTQYIIEGIEIEQIELDCLNVSYIDIALVVLGVWFVFKFLALIVPVTIRGFQHAINFMMIITTMIYSMALSLEIQTTSGVEKKIVSEGI